MSLRQTPSQTVGPFLHIGLPSHEQVATAQSRGQKITIEGQVLDGNGAPVTDAVLESWQANADGRYDHPTDTGAQPVDPAFHGFGRSATDAEGRFRLHTIKPGPVPNGDGTFQAPHLVINLFMRGLLKHLVTRLYFADDGSDAVLQLVPAERRATLIGNEANGLVSWNIVLQGENETVFFTI